MKVIAIITLKSILRDKILYAIGLVAILFLFIPVISTLSMRQVTELSIILSLSLISFILMLLAVFLGSTLLWKDIERRYTYSVLTLPLSRVSYLLGKFVAVLSFILFTTAILGAAAFIVISVTSTLYVPDRPVIWGNIFLCIFFDSLKSILLIALAFFFSTLSTSLFLPIFGSLAVYFAGNASQQVYEYLNSGGSSKFPVILKICSEALYFILPNLSAFDLNTYAIYGLQIDTKGLLLTFIYFVVYLLLVLSLTSLIFSRREVN